MKVKNFKFVLMVFAMMMTGLSFVSCSDDDDDNTISGFADYFMTVELVDKGDYSSQEATEIVAAFNYILSSQVFEGFKSDEINYYFEKMVKELFNEEVLDEIGFDDDKNITFRVLLKELKTEKVVKTATISIKNGKTTIKYQ